MRLNMLRVLMIAAACVLLGAQAEARQVLLVPSNSGLIKYDCQSGAYLGTLTGAMYERTSVAEANGILDVCASSVIKRYDVSTGRLVGSTSLSKNGYGQFGGMALGPDGCLYVSNTYSNQILRCDISTGNVQVVPLATNISQPWGVAFGSDGDMYTCAYLPSQHSSSRVVMRIRLSDGALVETYAGTKDLQYPQWISAVADGSIYALNQCAFGLYKLNRTAGRFDEIVPGGPMLGFNDMAFTSDGDGFLTQWNQSTSRFSVMRYDASTNALSYFAPSDKGLVMVATELPEPCAGVVLFSGLAGLISIRLRRR